MKTYAIHIDKKVSKQIAKLGKPVSKRIYTRIYGLVQNPRPAGAKKLVGAQEWRLRVGEYRVVYRIKDDKVLVIIVRAAHRKDIYR